MTFEKWYEDWASKNSSATFLRDESIDAKESAKAAWEYKLSKVIWTNLQQARMWEMITVARLFIDRFPSDSFRKKEDSSFSMVAIKQWQKDFKELKKAINNDH